MQQAQANQELAKVTWDRDGPLVKQGWLTAQQGTIDVQTLKAQEAAVSGRAGQCGSGRGTVAGVAPAKLYQRVVAPFDGVITQRNIDIGSLVQADATSGTFMFTIMQGDVIRTQVFVPQDEAFGLKPGIDAVVHVPEIPDRTFPGKVTRIADALQPGSRTLLTEIDIPNHDGVLAPEIYCTIELHIPRKTPSFTVSADAVIFNAGGVQVAVVENGVVHLRKVSVVRDLGQEVEINSGVKAGDQVILNPAVDLADGSKVRIRPRRRGRPELAASPCPPARVFLKSYLVVKQDLRAYDFLQSGPPRFSPGAGVDMAAKRTAHATPCSPGEVGGAVRPRGETPFRFD